MKHFIIAANLGDDQSMKCLWDHYTLGNVTKEDHQAAIDETKSSQRDVGEAFFRMKSAQRKEAEEFDRRLRSRRR